MDFSYIPALLGKNTPKYSQVTAYMTGNFTLITNINIEIGEVRRILHFQNVSKSGTQVNSRIATRPKNTLYGV